MATAGTDDFVEVILMASARLGAVQCKASSHRHGGPMSIAKNAAMSRAMPALLRLAGHGLLDAEHINTVSPG